MIFGNSNKFINKGFNPWLHLATNQRNKDMMQLLIQRKCYVNDSLSYKTMSSEDNKQ